MSIKDKLLAKTGDLTGAPVRVDPPPPPAPAPAPDTARPSAGATAASSGQAAPASATMPTSRTPAGEPQAPGWPAHRGHDPDTAGAPVANDDVATRRQPVPERQFPPVLPGVAAARTGPGQMLQFRGQLLAAEGELNKLRERLQQHDGALPTRRLDTAQVVPSRWANRHPDAFAAPEFLRLKHDIEQAGGNVQPILVRPIDGQPGQYELVFGHRRHRACADLGLPVLATIATDPVSDLELFSAMDRENRERADLSPYEQGQMYRRALDDKLYPSNRRLAEALGVSHTWVANVLLVADLPQPVVQCFRSPLDIQHRHARLIHQALDSDRKTVLRRADKLRTQPTIHSPAAVVQALLGAAAGASAARVAPPQPIRTTGGRPVGQWSTDAEGTLTIRIDAAAMAGQDPAAISAAVLSALAAPAGG